MQLTFKPLKGDNFHVEVDPEDKVGDVKKKIEELKSDFPAGTQKLIYSGKILADDQVIKDLDIKPDGFIVVMVTKAKAPAPAAPPAAAAPAPAATPATSPAADAPAATPAPAGPDATAQATSNVVTGGAAEATIKQLCDMGFGRPEVERCLAAAFGNPDRAVEYLMNGIPDGLDLPSAGGAPPPAATAPTAPAPGGGGNAAPFPAMGGAAPFPAMGGAGGGGGGPVEIPEALQQLRNNPQFGQLAAMVATNPGMLQQMLPALAQSNPELLAAIQQHPQAFMQMLQEAVGGGGGAGAGAGGPGMMGGMGMDPQLSQVAAMLQNNPEMVEQVLPEIEQRDPALAAAIRENPQAFVQMLQQASAGGMPMGGGGGGPAVISLTEEENAAVERLAALGFDKDMCAQAYLACEKNEEMAANFLFDNAGS